MSGAPTAFDERTRPFPGLPLAVVFDMLFISHLFIGDYSAVVVSLSTSLLVSRES
jgi:hypothetical protein